MYTHFFTFIILESKLRHTDQNRIDRKKIFTRSALKNYVNQTNQFQENIIQKFREIDSVYLTFFWGPGHFEIFWPTVQSGTIFHSFSQF